MSDIECDSVTGTDILYDEEIVTLPSIRNLDKNSTQHTTAGVRLIT